MLHLVFSRLRSQPAAACLAVFLVILTGCSPTYDWREVQGSDAPYMVMLPAKPATYSRPVNLNGLQVTMTMTAAQVKNASFAVGSAPVSDPKAVEPALEAMKTAMIRNINGTVRKEQRLPAANGAAQAVEIEAGGAASNGGPEQPLMLYARFLAKNGRVYQAVVLGPESDLPREEVDMFFSSFKVN